MREHCLIVGAGQAGATAAQTLRERGYAGRVTLAGEEPLPPYQRPPLSKKYLAGEVAADRLLLKGPGYWEANDVELRLDARIAELDLERGEARGSGAPIAFDRLVLATGARPKRCPAPGADLPGVHALRSAGDVDAIRPALRPGARLVIVGAGYIGLEVAAVARALGAEVAVLEFAQRVMARVVAPPVAAFYEALHRRNGVALHLGVGLAAIERRGDGLAALGTDGRAHPADLVLVAVGAEPRTELAAAAGLEIADGIVVDAACRTAHDAVVAAGDCTRFPSARYGRQIRLESVQNAIDQAKQAAATLAGAPATYDPLPWFWSDQFDVKLQIAGLADGHDRLVLRGDPASGAFSALYLAGDRLLAVDSVNRARDHMLARRHAGSRLAAPAEALADPERPWDGLFAAA
jgi:3-phenylpropionate/trans-cinnamate dioxygenase ferredoxin reductase subunit